MSTNLQRPRLEANAAYEHGHLVAQDLLEAIKEKLFDLPAPGNEENPIHWGHVGTMTHANDLLSQVLIALEITR